LRAEVWVFRGVKIGELWGLAEKTGIPVKTLQPMFGPKENPAAANLFNVVACL
jgi:hypothetical protein